MCTFTFRSDFIDRHALLIGHVAEHGEDDEARVDAGATVDEGDDEGVAQDVVVELVEGRHGDETAHRDAERVEDLSGGVRPHLRLRQPRPVRLSNNKDQWTSGDFLMYANVNVSGLFYSEYIGHNKSVHDVCT